MISEICATLRNYFLRDYRFPAKYIHTGVWTVADGQIQALPFLQVNQYFRIVGSVFNDGVWQYGVSELTDETFEGAIWEMAVPKDFVDLCDEIEKWVSDNADKLSSPYQSESFGGYSYSLKSGTSANGASADYGWKDQFASRLSRYRRLSVL